MDYVDNINLKINAKINAIGRHINPMEEDVWSVGSFSEHHVKSADEFFIESHSGNRDYASVGWDLANTKEYNIARVAWLMKTRDFYEDEAPINFYFYTMNGKPSFEIIDGNHRLSAAMVRGDEDIPILLEISPRAIDQPLLTSYVKDVLGVSHMASMV